MVLYKNVISGFAYKKMTHNEYSSIFMILFLVQVSMKNHKNERRKSFCPRLNILNYIDMMIYITCFTNEFCTH